MAELNESNTKHVRLLQSIFNFDDNDLIANRHGQVTSSQRYQLRDYYLKSQNDGLWLFIITVVGLWIGTSAISASQPFMGILTLLAVFIADTLLVADMLYKRSDKALNLLDETLLEVSGVAVLSTDRSNSNWLLLLFAPALYILQTLTSTNQYKIRIGGQRFTITSEAFHALQNGETYRVYFVRKKTPILSIEPISPEGRLQYLPHAKPTALQLDYLPRKKKSLE